MSKKREPLEQQSQRLEWEHRYHMAVLGGWVFNRTNRAVSRGFIRSGLETVWTVRGPNGRVWGTVFMTRHAAVDAVLVELGACYVDEAGRVHRIAVADAAGSDRTGSAGGVHVQANLGADVQSGLG